MLYLNLIGLGTDLNAKKKTCLIRMIRSFNRVDNYLNKSCNLLVYSAFKIWLERNIFAIGIAWYASYSVHRWTDCSELSVKSRLYF